MVKPFTPEQEQLLASIVPGLKSRKIGTEWTAIFMTERTAVRDDIHDRDINFVQLGWGDAKKADFNRFVKHGLFADAGQGNPITYWYRLDDDAIIQAYERGFDMPEPSAPVAGVDMRYSTFTGITNVNSRIENSTQIIQNASGLSSDFKKTLIDLLTELDTAIADVPEGNNAEVHTLKKQAARLAEDVSEPKPDKASAQITAEGLKKAAENLAKVAPIVVPIAMEIVKHIQALP